MIEGLTFSIGGTPTDEEIAAISSAASLWLSSLQAESVDNSVSEQNLWVRSHRHISRTATRLPGQTQKWSSGNRLIGRIPA